MDWNDILHFLTLARMKSVRAAGSCLGVSHSTVLRRVEALEAQLGTRLFDRTRDGYVLTAAGEQMLPGAERVEQEMAALARGVAGADERLAGRVTLTCCDGYVARLLLAGLRDMCAAHPGIELAINVDTRAFDLSRSEADIAVRTLRCGVQPPSHLIAQPLVPLVIANYAARAHADRLPTRWLGFEPADAQAALVAQSSHADLPCWGVFSSLELMVDAAHAGLGLVMLPTYVGDGEPQLLRLAQADIRHVADLWLLSHPDLRDNARIRTVRRHVAQVFADQQPLFDGRRGCFSHPAGADSDRPDGAQPA
ncbi:LysR family transcriptional regulator [Roseateles sp. LYH14W]|uniref:LysR family transcriptional regulator n=1 Tax=Pelomonas parva TaxID=3299032 RepID=A0ABW7F6S7_9BURK